MAHFKGFRELDFNQVKGTTWRSREEFGGVIVDRLGREFQSWAIYGWQGLHIGPEKEGPPEVESAKLFIAAHNEKGGGLAYGLYIECAGRESAASVHWRNLKKGLVSGDKMKTLLISMMEKHDFTVGKFAGADDHDPQWRFQSERGRLCRLLGEAKEDATFEQLIGKIVELPKGKWVDLYIFSRMSKADAINQGEAVSESVSKTLLACVPLYCQIIDG